MEGGLGEKRFHCDHCGEKISRSLYFEHKKLYYSSTSNTWKKELFPKRTEQFEDFIFPAQGTENESEEGM